MSANTKTCSWTVTVDCTEGDCRIQTNNCLAFDGVDDRVTAASPLSTTALMTNFTVGCFFRNDRTNGGNFYRLFGWSSTDRFEVGDQNGFLTFYSTLSSAVVSTVNIRDGQWHYLAAVKSGTSVTIYLDGVAVPGLTGINVGTFNNLAPISALATGPSAGRQQLAGFGRGFQNLEPGVFRYPGTKRSFCSADPVNTNLITHFSFDQGVPGSNNAGLTTALNSVAGGSNGSSGFTLNGAVSNWAISGIRFDLLGDFLYPSGRQRRPQHSRRDEGVRQRYFRRVLSVWARITTRLSPAGVRTGASFGGRNSTSPAPSMILYAPTRAVICWWAIARVLPTATRVLSPGWITTATWFG